MTTLVECDPALAERIGQDYGPKTRRHLHLDDGFTLVAVEQGEPVGFLAVAVRPAEAFIDILEVREDRRRRGIGRALVEAAAKRTAGLGLARLRAWSSADKTAAIALWRALGFELHPATLESRGATVDGYFASLKSGGSTGLPG